MTCISIFGFKSTSNEPFAVFLRVLKKLGCDSYPKHNMLFNYLIHYLKIEVWPLIGWLIQYHLGGFEALLRL